MGKSTGKTILSIAGFAFGFTNPAAFLGAGSTAVWTAGLMGASLGSTIWSSTHPQKQPSQTYDFSSLTDKISSESPIPIIYGTRKFGGYQTYHFVESSKNKLVKDVILCEGEVDSIYGVTANARLISRGPLFYIKNTVHSDATVEIANGGPTSGDKILRLRYSGFSQDIYLQSPCDINENNSNDYSCSSVRLAAYIEELGNGWKITENTGADHPPENIETIGVTNCYNNSIPLIVSGLSSCSYVSITGASTQAPPDNYGSVGGYKNCAGVRAYLTSSDDLTGGDPTVTALVRGMKIVDTRKSYSTKAYSENPAMIVRDYLLAKRYGMGRWIDSSMIDEDSFQEIADYCDEVVHYTDANGNAQVEPRYALNLIIADSRSHIDNLQTMLASFGGLIIFYGNKIGLSCEKVESASYAFNDNNIGFKDGAFDIKWETSALTDCPNRYIVTYFDPAQNWTAIKVTVDDTADQEQRGRIIPKEVTLDGCTSQSQALRLARIYKAVNRLCVLRPTFSTGTMAAHLRPGDVITITHGPYTGYPFRITEITEDNNKYTLKCRQYIYSIYDDALGSHIVLPTGVDTSRYHKPPRITNVVAYTNVDDEILVQHDSSTDSNFKEYRYYIEEVN